MTSLSTKNRNHSIMGRPVMWTLKLCNPKPVQEFVCVPNLHNQFKNSANSDEYQIWASAKFSGTGESIIGYQVDLQA